jgi:hypothetical protein
MAYNLSVLMRYKIKKSWNEEHATFRAWFINDSVDLIVKQT